MSVTLENLLERSRLRRRLPDPEIRRLLRSRSGLSQAEVAELIGVQPASVCRWESGQRTPQGAALESYVVLLERLSKEAA